MISRYTKFGRKIIRVRNLYYLIYPPRALKVGTIAAAPKAQGYSLTYEKPESPAESKEIS